MQEGERKEEIFEINHCVCIYLPSLLHMMVFKQGTKQVKKRDRSLNFRATVLNEQVEEERVQS